MEIKSIAPIPERCTGCRNCELVCSFHHQRKFDRNLSSVMVERKEREGEFKIEILPENNGGHLACDLCANEEFPLCVKFCPTQALRDVR